VISPASWLVLGTATLLLPPFVAAAADAVRPQTPPLAAESAQVLVITGSDPYLPAFVEIDAAMRKAVARQQRHVSWLYEPIDALRLGDRADRSLADLLVRKYEGTRIDAIVLVTDPALDFYVRHRDQLWPGVPAVYNFVAPKFARSLPPDPKLTGLPAELDFAQTLRIALALQPAAKRVLVVSGSSPWDQSRLAEAQRALAEHPALAVEVVSGQSPRAVAERLAGEPDGTFVLFSTLLADATGRVYTARDALATLAAASRVPVYGSFDTYVGAGLTAGAVESLRDRGERVGALVMQALDGQPGATLVESPASRCVADARQLARFGLARSKLPAGCDVRYVEPTFLQRYWWQSLLVGLALLGQSILIASLLIQRAHRRRAEVSLQAQRVQLLHASRLAVAGELTASIAHEINQPLGAILSNADAADMLLQSGTIERAELQQILADIRRDDLRASEVIRRLRALLARHEVERRRFSPDVALEDAVHILAAEARRRGFTVETALTAAGAEILGDPVQIQQVIVNLALNAFDAASNLPPDRRRVRFGSTDTPAGLQITVRDFGSGIATADLPRLFDPFFTTKSTGMGLGLSIVRSIIEAHGGTIVAANRDPGAEFTITLPRAPSPQRPATATDEA
jgi:signal transduction histidine kinase